MQQPRWLLGRNSTLHGLWEASRGKSTCKSFMEMMLFRLFIFGAWARESNASVGNGVLEEIQIREGKQCLSIYSWWGASPRYLSWVHFLCACLMSFVSKKVQNPMGSALSPLQMYLLSNLRHPHPFCKRIAKAAKCDRFQYFFYCFIYWFSYCPTGMGRLVVSGCPLPPRRLISSIWVNGP